MKMLNRRSGLTLGVLIVLLFCWTGATVVAQPPKGDAWQKVWDTLAEMPVQSEGMTRSYRSFCRNMLIAVADETSYGGAGPIATITWLLSDESHMQESEFFPVDHPKAAEIFKSETVSFERYSEVINDLREDASNSTDQSFKKSVSRMIGRANTLLDLPYHLAFVPQEESDWLSPYEILTQADSADVLLVEHWARVLEAVRQDDAEAAQEAAQSLVPAVQKRATPELMSRIRIDSFYTAMQPFKRAALLYVFAALSYAGALILSFKQRNRWLPWVGLGFMGLGLLVHMAGIVMRWRISGRAPLSDSYETLVFAVAGLVLTAIIIEIITRIRLAGLVCSILGFVFVVVAQVAPIFDSSIRPLQPALQSVWLTYHVVTIMLSYACFLLSAIFAAMYLFDFLIGGKKQEGSQSAILPVSLQTLDTLQYRLVAVGFPLLTVGIILGAVWAERAWGRPWGFDPKETWSAITWMVYAAYLHVRFMRGWRGAGAALVCLLGFACVLFTYFGVNFLLSGLHSYA